MTDDTCTGATNGCVECHADCVEETDGGRQRCEIWTRVMGYHRPIDSFNAGKRQEHRDRVPFSEPCGGE